MPMQATDLHVDAKCKEMQASGLHLNANAGASYKTRMHISLNAKNAHCLFREVLGERLNGTSCNRTPLQTVSLKGHVRCAWLVGILFMTCDERLVGSAPPQVRRLQLRPCHHIRRELVQKLQLSLAVILECVMTPPIPQREGGPELYGPDHRWHRTRK